MPSAGPSSIPVIAPSSRPAAPAGARSASGPGRPAGRPRHDVQRARHEGLAPPGGRELVQRLADRRVPIGVASIAGFAVAMIGTSSGASRRASDERNVHDAEVQCSPSLTVTSMPRRRPGEQGGRVGSRQTVEVDDDARSSVACSASRCRRAAAPRARRGPRPPRRNPALRILDHGRRAIRPAAEGASSSSAEQRRRPAAPAPSSPSAPRIGRRCRRWLRRRRGCPPCQRQGARVLLASGAPPWPQVGEGRLDAGAPPARGGPAPVLGHLAQRARARTSSRVAPYPTRCRSRVPGGRRRGGSCAARRRGRPAPGHRVSTTSPGGRRREGRGRVPLIAGSASGIGPGYRAARELAVRTERGACFVEAPRAADSKRGDRVELSRSTQRPGLPDLARATAGSGIVRLVAPRQSVRASAPSRSTLSRSPTNRIPRRSSCSTVSPGSRLPERCMTRPRPGRRRSSVGQVTRNALVHCRSSTPIATTGGASSSCSCHSAP